MNSARINDFIKTDVGASLKNSPGISRGTARDTSSQHPTSGARSTQSPRDRGQQGPAGLAVKAAGLAQGQRGFDSHRSHAR